MNKQLLLEYIVKSNIENIKYTRGYGLIPARFEIYLNKDNKRIVAEIETNFRVLYKGNNILSFDDIFLDLKANEFTTAKFRKQKNIEDSLLNKNLELVNKVFHNKNICSCIIHPYGDIDFNVIGVGKLQIINDTHMNDSVLLRLLDCDNKKLIEGPNGIIVESYNTICEFKICDMNPKLIIIK